MFKTPNNIQSVDEKCNLIYPWYTCECICFLRNLNVKHYDVFEWGGGCSTVWYAHNCKSVTTIETSKEWADEIVTYLDNTKKTNYSIKVVDVPPSANSPCDNMNQYLSYIAELDQKFDLIVVDGSYRNDALLISEKFVKNGGYIIYDNYLQFTSGYEKLPNAEYMNSKYDLIVNNHNTEDHKDWKTAVWKIENQTDNNNL
jgi:predicted O-methyltransferase YrrM